ncbi:HAD family hydrolase [Nocardia sp. NPDC004711]
MALFDLDDTLVDQTGAFGLWVFEFAEEHRLPDGAVGWLQAAPKMWPGPKERMFNEIRAHFRLAEPVELLWQRYRHRMPELVRPRPGVLEGLALLRGGGWIVGIVSNGALDNQLGKLERTGLAEHVDGYCISGEVGLRKPDVRIFELAARQIGADAVEQGWMIGDDPELDVAGGHRAGMRTCWISHGRTWNADLPVPTRQAHDTRAAIDALLSPDASPR